MATVKELRALSPVYDVTLHASGLWSKFGFGDGDVISEHVYEDPELEAFDNLLQDLPQTLPSLDHMALMALVELYLLPKLDRPVTLHHTNYLHNGVRVQEAEWWDKNDYEFEESMPEVKISGTHVLEIMHAVKRVLEQWLRGETMTWPSCLAQTARVAAEEFNGAIQLDDQLALPAPALLLEGA